MIFPIHKKLNNSRFDPPSHNIWQELLRIVKVIYLPILALIWILLKFDDVGIGEIVAFTFIAVFCYI